jgi:hypothetical protein
MYTRLIFALYGSRLILITAISGTKAKNILHHRVKDARSMAHGSTVVLQDKRDLAMAK